MTIIVKLFKNILIKIKSWILIKIPSYRVYLIYTQLKAKKIVQ